MKSFGFGAGVRRLLPFSRALSVSPGDCCCTHRALEPWILQGTGGSSPGDMRRGVKDSSSRWLPSAPAALAVERCLVLLPPCTMGSLGRFSASRGRGRHPSRKRNPTSLLELSEFLRQLSRPVSFLPTLKSDELSHGLVFQLLEQVVELNESVSSMTTDSVL